MGNVHARQYRKLPGVELSFFDRDPQVSAAYAARWEASPAASVKELLARCDLIDICLPTDMHLEAGLEAVAQGCAVFMEKPLAKDLDQCRRLLEAAQKDSIPLGTGQVVRYFAEFATGNRVVRDGGVGTPAAARTRRGGAAPRGRNEWFMDHARSGGVLLDLAIHDFDWLRWTLGEVKYLYARSVGAQTGQGPDYALTTLTFESGAVAHVEATWMDPSGFRTTYEVAGSAGLIEWDSRKNAALRTHTPGGAQVDGGLAPLDDPYFLEIRDFVAAVRGGGAPPVDGYDGFMAVSIAQTALESARTGQVLTPPRS